MMTLIVLISEIILEVLLSRIIEIGIIHVIIVPMEMTLMLLEVINFMFKVIILIEFILVIS